MATGPRRPPVRVGSERSTSRSARAVAVVVLAGAVVACLLAATTGTGGADPGPPGSVPGTNPDPSGTTPGAGTLPLVPPDDPSVPTARDVAERACLGGGRPVEALDPDHGVPWPPASRAIEPGTAFDARSEVFDNSTLDRAGFGIGVKVHHDETRRDLCFVGGTIRTDLDPEGTPWDTWHRVTAMTVENPGFTVVGTSFANEGDLIAFVGDPADWQVIGVRADGGRTHPGAYAHDDCVENDNMASGLIDDSKFDGCTVFLSSTNASVRAVDGGDHRVVVRDTLVRLQPFRNSFNTPKYGEDAHGGFFKWSFVDRSVMVPPKLTVTDSVFRSDTPARYGGNENGFLGLPPGTECARVVLIGTEAWPDDELASWQDQCTDLRLATAAEWDAAVARWDARHPPMRDLAAQGRDLVSAAAGW